MPGVLKRWQGGLMYKLPKCVGLLRQFEHSCQKVNIVQDIIYGMQLGAVGTGASLEIKAVTHSLIRL